MTACDYQRVMTEAVCRVLSDALAAGAFGRDGLSWVRSALDPQTTLGKAWFPCLAVDVLRVGVDTALARSYGAEPEDLNTLPDFPPDGVT